MSCISPVYIEREREGGRGERKRERGGGGEEGRKGKREEEKKGWLTNEQCVCVCVSSIMHVYVHLYC